MSREETAQEGVHYITTDLLERIGACGNATELFEMWARDVRVDGGDAPDAGRGVPFTADMVALYFRDIGRGVGREHLSRLLELGGVPATEYNREVCMSLGPMFAYVYADSVEQGPHDGTRRVACEDPGYAFLYARYVDKCSRDDTRRAACGMSMYAYRYARYVDKCFREDSYDAARKDPFYRRAYERLFADHLSDTTAVP